MWETVQYQKHHPSAGPPGVGQEAGEDMGITYRKRKKVGKNSWLNLSGSGASASTKLGPLTLNSRGGLWVKLPGGFNYRGRWK